MACPGFALEVFPLESGSTTHLLLSSHLGNLTRLSLCKALEPAGAPSVYHAPEDGHDCHYEQHIPGEQDGHAMSQQSQNTMNKQTNKRNNSMQQL